MEAKGNQFTNMLKDKNIPTKKEESKTPDKTNKSLSNNSFSYRFLIGFKNFYTKVKKFMTKGSKFGLFLLSVTLYIIGPAYIQNLNIYLYNYIRVNGGLRKDGGMGGMRPF